MNWGENVPHSLQRKDIEGPSGKRSKVGHLKKESLDPKIRRR